jgi:small-conductance mechanosensitive channel
MRLFLLPPRCGVVLFGAALFASAGLAATRDDELISQLREQIAQLEKSPASESQSIFGFDADRAARRLGVLRQELAVLEKRQQLEAREKSLRAPISAQPREQLRGKLQAVAPDTVGIDARVRDLAQRRTQATAERDTYARREADLKRNEPPAGQVLTPAAAAEATEVEEKLITKDEELRAIALRTEATENEADLVHLAQLLRLRLKEGEELAAHPTLRGMLSVRARQEDDDKMVARIGPRLANFEATLRNTETVLDVLRQKVAGFEDEIRVFEVRPAGAGRRPPRMDQMLATDRVQLKMLGERLPFIAEQAEAQRRSIATLQAQQELLALALQVQAEDLAAARNLYVARLRTPAIVVAALIVFYLLLSRVILPRRLKKEELFLARRIGGYGVIFLTLVVIAFGSIDDLRLLATTVGVASAGIVIALQDVATSMCGWCAIMLGRKFKIGDRLEIDGVRGDVLDIQLMRTTMVELNNWLGVDQPTGRVFMVPNNFIFKSKVFNYSHGHPYIWGMVEVTVTYATPVASALALFNKVLEEETRESFAEAKAAAREMERRYGVEDADYRPKVYTRIADCGVTFSMLYVAHYKGSSSMRNRINRRLIAELETHQHIRLAYPTRQLITSDDATLPSAVLGADATRVPFGRAIVKPLP